MPVPTETFRRMRTLNLIFAASALLLAVATLWMIMADHNRPWRQYPLAATAWDAAIYDAEDQLLATDKHYDRQLAEAREQLEDARRNLDHEKISAIDQKIAELKADIGRMNLKTQVKKSIINPTKQKLEQSEHRTGDSRETVRLRKALEEAEKKYFDSQQKLAQFEGELAKLTRELDTLRAAETEQLKKVGNLEQKKLTLQAKLKQAAPRGLAKIDRQVRDMPLLDWLNPPLKPQQVVVPDIRTDYNFITVETIDRCQTCHVNIDDTRFTMAAQIRFVEQELTRQEGYTRSETIRDPLGLLNFWIDATKLIPEPDDGLDRINQATLEWINELHSEADDGVEITSVEELHTHLNEIVTTFEGNENVSQVRWLQVVRDHRESLRAYVAKRLGKEQFARLLELYRRTAIARYNENRRRVGKNTLNDSPVLLAHPRLDLYITDESAHPMGTMGCTVCHEGSGQETQFEHTVHEPREAWVDEESGSLIPDFLIVRTGTLKEIRAWVNLPRTGDRGTATESESHVSAAGIKTDQIVAVSITADQHSGQLSAHHDAPYQPTQDTHGMAAAYRLPGRESTEHVAVQQKTYWTGRHGWHHVTNMHWEKPMHQLSHVESACARCHTDVYDIRDEAPQLFKGRKLFAQLGCVNCHAVAALANDLDIKRVGPSLVHINQKLSEQMMATWIWSPKAFRPTTRMPHYFMLANNSAPEDILRTRVEAAAMARYLAHAEPNLNFYHSENLPDPLHDPERPPAEFGDPERGREIFLQVGCMACHTNLAEFDRKWIMEDLTRRGLSEPKAQSALDEKSYNERHRYVLKNLSHRLELTGPELSGVGTKLLVGRTEEQARDWIFDWLRDPRRHSSYTIMPRLRLSVDETNDLTAYLLTLQRPGHESDNSTYVPGDFTLDESGWKALREIRAIQNSGKSTLEIARGQIANRYLDSHEGKQKLMLDAGKALIQHYGCHGCHLINGLEADTSACTNLDEWGLKDPHKLAFDYFSHTFDKMRRKPIKVWKVAKWGLMADAAQIKPEDERVRKEMINWEHMDTERRPWLYHKLHNTRLYDRGRNVLDGKAPEGTGFDIARGHGFGKPYDKLKMPQFFLSDQEVRALVTFVTSIRKPLVTERMQQVADEAGRRVTRGRQLATVYNCYGCHNIEGNKVNIQQYFHVRAQDGSYNADALNWAPPRLVGQGAKTQPDWLYHFVQNVEPIRSWLNVRMPSFPLDAKHARGLVDYFAGHTQVLARRLSGLVAPIVQHIDARSRRVVALDEKIRDLQKRRNETSDKQWRGKLSQQIESRQQERAEAVQEREAWFSTDTKNPLHGDVVKKLADFAIKADLLLPSDLDPRQQDAEDLGINWNKALTEAQILADTYHTDYPYVQQHKPNVSLEHLVRGEKLFVELGCMTGECHRFGEQELLIASGQMTRTKPFSIAVLNESEEEDEWEDDEAGETETADDEEYDYGDEEEYGDEEGETDVTLTPSTPPSGAPNLNNVHGRLQPTWVRHWIRHPAVIQPGTRMLPFFVPNDEGRDSHFADIPDDRKEKEAMYGFTGDQQLDLLMDFLYTAGPKRFTYDVEGKRLDRGEQPKVELKPREHPEPPVAEVPAPAPSDGAPDKSKPATGPQTPPYETVTTSPPAAKLLKPTSNIELHDEPTVESGQTRIAGIVKFAGKLKKRKTVNMNTDRFCAAHAAAGPAPPLDETLIVNDDGMVQNTFIYVKAGLGEKKWPVPVQPIVLDQIGCTYVPHVLGVMTGQTLNIVNSDKTLHNVNLYETAQNKKFNSASPKGKSLIKIFKKVEIGTMKLKCDIHGWMGARVHVVDHPFFAVSDVGGRYEITGLDPGQYTLEAVHEDRRVRPVEFEVEVKESTSHRVDIEVVRY